MHSLVLEQVAGLMNQKAKKRDDYLAALSAHNTGQYERAIELYQKACDVGPC